MSGCGFSWTLSPRYDVTDGYCVLAACCDGHTPANISLYTTCPSMRIWGFSMGRPDEPLLGGLEERR